MSNEKRDKAYQRIVSLLHRYRDCPNMLCHMLFEQQAFTQDFLLQMASGDYGRLEQEKFYGSFEELERYVKCHVFNAEQREPQTDPGTVYRNLEQELQRCIACEDYESAERIRGYMDALTNSTQS